MEILTLLVPMFHAPTEHLKKLERLELRGGGGSTAGNDFIVIWSQLVWHDSYVCVDATRTKRIMQSAFFSQAARVDVASQRAWRSVPTFLPQRHVAHKTNRASVSQCSHTTDTLALPGENGHPGCYCAGVGTCCCAAT